MSAFFQVLYMANAVAALAAGVASGPLGVQTATSIVAGALAVGAALSVLLSARQVPR
jgi:hypothetical protein